MSSSADSGPQAVLDALDRLEEAADGFVGLPADELTELDQVSVLCRLATIARKFIAHQQDVSARRFRLLCDGRGHAGRLRKGEVSGAWGAGGRC